MTVTSTINRITYTGDGSTVSFPVPFAFFNAEEILVIERTLATGVEAVKTLTTHYTVSGGDGSTGTVSAVAPPPDTVSWTIIRVTRRTQEIDYADNDAFPAATHERGLDRLTMIAQDSADAADRALRVSQTDDPSVSLVLPSSIARAGKLLAFDSTGKPIAVAAGLDTALVSSFMETLLLAEDANAVLSGLSLETVGQSEAEAGTAQVDRLWTAQRVAQAVLALAPATGAPRGYIDGFQMSNAGNVLTIGPGALEAAGAYFNHTSAGFTKDLAADFTKGTGNGGRGQALPATGTVHIFLITEDATGDIDFYSDTDIGAVNGPAGWTVRRRIGSLRTSGSVLRDFLQIGDRFLLRTPVTDVSVTNQGQSAVTRSLTVPVGVGGITALLNALVSHASFSTRVYLRHPNTVNQAPSTTSSPLATLNAQSGGGINTASLKIDTNVAGEIESRSEEMNTILRIATLGWIDHRGKDAS